MHDLRLWRASRFFPILYLDLPGLLLLLFVELRLYFGQRGSHLEVCGLTFFLLFQDGFSIDNCGSSKKERKSYVLIS
ncbi:MAG TPA: hypothetical protein VJO32_01695 [Ktedonobacteraceae bacterium]|nr:hypothetical protein [Ktedonobacteraceae bacterium]